MKETIRWFVGGDLLFSMTTYWILQANVPDYVISNTAKVAAALFVGFIGGFMGVLGKRAAEDYLRHRKQKKERNERLKRDTKGK